MGTLPFGFEVKRGDSGWRVHLPHQCDEWDIAGQEYGEVGVPHDQAVTELERFITEAQEALELLKAERQLTRPWKFGDPAPTKEVS